MALLTTSWDDGAGTDLELGRRLAERGARATFYATTGPSGARTIDDAGLAELRAFGHELGNHGRTHRVFTELSAAELRAEVEWGQAETARFGDPAPVVAPPRGHMNAEVVGALRAAGLAVRAAPILGGRAIAGVLMPTAQVYPHSRSRTASHLIRRRLVPRPSALASWSAHRDLFDRLRALAHSAHRHGRDLHLWGHSSELARHDLWERFDALLVELLALGFEPVTNGELLRRRGAR